MEFYKYRVRIVCIQKPNTIKITCTSFERIKVKFFFKWNIEIVTPEVFYQTGCSKVAMFFIIHMNIQVKVQRQVEHIYTCIYAWVRKYKNKIGKMRGKWDGKERKVMKQQGRVFTIRDVRRPRSCSNTQLLSMGKMMLVLPKQFSIKLGLFSISFSMWHRFQIAATYIV